ncbi:MAG: TraB/GumN family protein, partial [Flavobacteriales bacterium]|nr:TraB/GumN family protein [Flavobacteriales bacterium]
MTLGKSIKSTILIVLLVLAQNNRSFAQDQQYPSLLWEITGNGLSKPSYLFGTMHVSDKIAFRLGSPFFEALEKVDVLAMELEPELWFDEVLKGDVLSEAFDFDKSFGYEYENYGSREWNRYYGTFELDKNLDANIQAIFKSNPTTLNRLLFRFDEMNANFEESTWLDMYIYQSAKKLKKQTYGLETFEESMSMQVKSTQDKDLDTKNSDYKKLSYSDRMEVHLKIEDAYRRGDLDQLDSLTKLVSEPSFLKYILIERNKNFMVGIDTLIKKRPTFVAVGAAHLPGKEGCIEMLRDLGYTVKPVSMGKKDGKQKKYLEELFIKRPLKNYTSPDGVVSFDTPYN